VDVTSVLSPPEPTESDRPRSKSSPHLDIGNASISKDMLPTSTSSSSLNTLPNSSAKKGRFTVTMGVQNSAPPSPMKPQAQITNQEQLVNAPSNPQPHSASSPLVHCDALPPAGAAQQPASSNQGESVHKHQEEASGRQTPVGIALENKTQTTQSSMKKSKSRFTVKTISLEVRRGLPLSIHFVSLDHL
jgi:hypothetical protein